MNTEKLQKVAIVFLAVALLLALAFCSFYRKSLSAVESGAANGFNLAGTYEYLDPNESSGGVTSISFEIKDEDSASGTWQVKKTDAELLDGSFKGTFDPNIYSLYDENGNEVALAHVMYSGSKADNSDDGLSVVVTGDSLEFKLPKKDDVIVYYAQD